MAHGLDEPNELTLIRCQRPMARGDGAAEERHRVTRLDQHGAETV